MTDGRPTRRKGIATGRALVILTTLVATTGAAGRHWADVGFAGVRLTSIASDVELLSYEATARWNDEKTPARTLCATLYARRGDTWRVLFHQQTSI